MEQGGHTTRKVSLSSPAGDGLPLRDPSGHMFPLVCSGRHCAHGTWSQAHGAVHPPGLWFTVSVEERGFRATLPEQVGGWGAEAGTQRV